MLVREDFYSAQDLLREEQQRLLSLLKDASHTWPLEVAAKGKRKKPSRPSTPPAIGKPEAEADDDDMKTTAGADEYCKTKVLQLGKTKNRNQVPPSIYHQGCAPEEPERNFTATPIPSRLLKGRLQRPHKSF